MHGLLRLFVLVAVTPLVDAVSAKSFRRSRTRTKAPGESSMVYASKGKFYAVDNFNRQLFGNATGNSDSPQELPKKPQHVELFRFVTAYRAPMEALLDMTPYAPLIKAAVKSDNLTLYNFLDTWVNNHTEQNIVYMNNVTGKCYPEKMSQGNGWSMSASLLFWPHKEKPENDPSEPSNTHPRELVSLASGWYGSVYPIGRIGQHIANITEGGKALMLEKPADFSTVKKATVYNLKNDEMGIARLIGYVAQRSEILTLADNDMQIDYLFQDVFESMLWQGITAVKVTGIDNATNVIYGKYNKSEVQWEPKMPVFFNSGDVYTEVDVGDGWWLNSTMPLKPIGEVTKVDGENVTIQLYNKCLPENRTNHLPTLLIPVTPRVLDAINNTLHKAIKRGRDKATAKMAPINSEHAPSNDSDSGPDSNGDFEVMLLLDRDSPFINSNAKSSPVEPVLDRLQLLAPNSTDLVSPTMLGILDLSAAGSGGSDENTWRRLMLTHPIDSKYNVTDGSQVIVVTEESHGRLMERHFELPNLQYGDRIIVQMVVTGHGWASTAEQCGEYCHAVYLLSLNGRSAANITQFRDDCKDNPINGSYQYGTWDESRNGWCPGTVVPGLFIDMTDHMQRGTNHLTIDLVVWDNATSQYEPYTDYAGFVFEDQAELGIGMTAFVYDQNAVDTIRAQSQAFTAAEVAIQQGCSSPQHLKPPAFVHEPMAEQVFLEMGAKSLPHRPLVAHARSRASRSMLPRQFLEHQHDPLGLRRRLREYTSAGFHPEYMSTGSSQRSVVRREEGSSRLVRTEIFSQGQAATGKRRHHFHEVQHHRSNVEVGVHEFGNGDVNESYLNSTIIPDLERFNFENRAPWYLYNETVEGEPQFLEDGNVRSPIRVPVFEHRLMQGNSRDVQSKVDVSLVPKDWRFVAIHFELQQPDGLELDHWDRVGSMGLRFR